MRSFIKRRKLPNIRLYFNGLSVVEAKMKYLKLCKQHHPDMGGNVVIFRDVQEKYEKFTKSLSDRDISLDEAIANLKKAMDENTQSWLRNWQPHGMT